MIEKKECIRKMFDDKKCKWCEDNSVCKNEQILKNIDSYTKRIYRCPKMFLFGECFSCTKCKFCVMGETMVDCEGRFLKHLENIEQNSQDGKECTIIFDGLSDKQTITDGIILDHILINSKPCNWCNKKCDILDEVLENRKVKCNKFNLYLIAVKELNRLRKSEEQSLVYGFDERG